MPGRLKANPQNPSVLAGSSPNVLDSLHSRPAGSRQAGRAACLPLAQVLGRKHGLQKGVSRLG
jgi:hypothetical protein